MEVDATVAFTLPGGAHALAPHLSSLVEGQVIASSVIDDFASIPPQVLPR